MWIEHSEKSGDEPGRKWCDTPSTAGTAGEAYDLQLQHVLEVLENACARSQALAKIPWTT